MQSRNSVHVSFINKNTVKSIEGGKPPLHTNMQFFHPAVQYHTVRYHILYGTLPIPYGTIPYTIWHFSLLFPMAFFPSFSTFILMFWLSLSSQLSLPGPSLGGHSTHHQQGFHPCYCNNIPPLCTHLQTRAQAPCILPVLPPPGALPVLTPPPFLGPAPPPLCFNP